MIDYDERRAGNPSLDFIQRAAEALDVCVAELLGSQPKAAHAASLAQLLNYNSASIRLDDSPGEQEFVIRFIDTVLEKPQEA